MLGIQVSCKIRRSSSVDDLEGSKPRGHLLDCVQDCSDLGPVLLLFHSETNS